MQKLKTKQNVPWLNDIINMFNSPNNMYRWFQVQVLTFIAVTAIGQNKQTRSVIMDTSLLV